MLRGELQEAAENLKAAIDRFVAAAEGLSSVAAAPHRCGVGSESPVPIELSPEQSATIKVISRKERQLQKETYAMAALVRMEGCPRLDLIAEAVARHFGSCNPSSLYRYSRFMRLYKMARDQAAESARARVRSGFMLSKDDGGGIEAIDPGDAA